MTKIEIIGNAEWSREDDEHGWKLGDGGIDVDCSLEMILYRCFFVSDFVSVGFYILLMVPF